MFGSDCCFQRQDGHIWSVQCCCELLWMIRWRWTGIDWFPAHPSSWSGPSYGDPSSAVGMRHLYPPHGSGTDPTGRTDCCSWNSHTERSYRRRRYSVCASGWTNHAARWIWQWAPAVSRHAVMIQRVEWVRRPLPSPGAGWRSPSQFLHPQELLKWSVIQNSTVQAYEPEDELQQWWFSLQELHLLMLQREGHYEVTALPPTSVDMGRSQIQQVQVVRLLLLALNRCSCRIDIDSKVRVCNLCAQMERWGIVIPQPLLLQVLLLLEAHEVRGISSTQEIPQ